MHEAEHIAEIVAGIVALLLIAAATLAVTKRIKLPFTVVLVLVGIGLSELAAMYPENLKLLEDLRISPGIILYVFLPSLIFESAFNMDARALRKNLWTVLMLAVPGLLVSTVMIGAFVALGASIPWPAALLLGAILSATDPVAVVALFKKLGAPQRLTILVEGESLFNDATSLVVARILVNVILVGTVSTITVFQGVLDFIVVFMGGLAVGAVLGFFIGWVLGKVESDPLIEITLTTVLAYLSYLIAEEAFHVSGVMATIAGGLVLGGWGRMRVSHAVREYLEHFWEYLAFIANALIFLMVGLRVDLTALWASSTLLGLVILAMLVSRAAVVFGIVPFVKKLPEAEEVSREYQAVMYWGGLRGAIALAIVLSLPQFGFNDDFVAVTMGAVLFTLLVQALSIERLVKTLGLNVPPLADRFAHAEGALRARQKALRQLPILLSGGLFSGPIAGRLTQQCEATLMEAKKELEALRTAELDDRSEYQLLLLRALGEEKSVYIEMFNKGQISERSFRYVLATVSLQADSVRYSADFKPEVAGRLQRRKMEESALRVMESFPLLGMLAESIRLNRVARDYERAWARYQGSGAVVNMCDGLLETGTMNEAVVNRVKSQYAVWRENAQHRLDGITELFPEFVSTLQERLGQRLILFSESESISHEREKGTLPASVAESMQEHIAEGLARLKGLEVSKLRVEPTELLRKVPFFQDVPEDQFEAIAQKLRAHTYSRDEVIVQQDTKGDSLFLIARGVVRVSRTQKGTSRDLATLMAGDFFGEMALVLHEPRTATVRAVTPCSIYELRSEDLVSVTARFPGIMETLKQAALRRKEEQAR